MKSLTVKVDGSGRILLPVKVREKLDLKQGSKLTLHLGKDSLRLTTQAQAIKRAQEYFSRLPRGRMLASDELIQERRREARREWST
ncbi:MAG TPA: AbrB/MazE/SpoVT family DNA-binding domain-containing protein [Bryobacteraceae bacterium]|nr:AbrB/MazE/SpoVT family DNA-binding domain-containing protein [Bryobacteraceae bacterium]